MYIHTDYISMLFMYMLYMYLYHMYAYVELYNYYMLTYVCSLCSVCNMHAYFCIYFSFSFRSTIASLPADGTLFSSICFSI